MSLPLHNTVANFRSETELAESMPAASTANDDAAIAQRFDALVHALCPDAPGVDGDCLRRIVALLGDPDWACDPAERDALQRLLSAARGTVAIDSVRDIAWPPLAHAPAAYAAYERARLHEAQVRRQAPGSFHFDRHDWETAQQSALRDQLKQVRETSYAPFTADWFRVH